MALLPPRCFPNHLGKETGIGKKGVLPHRLCLREKMKEMQWKNCQLEQLLPRHLRVPPATRGEAPMSQKGWQQQLLTQCWRAPEATWAAEVQGMEIVCWREEQSRVEKEKEIKSRSKTGSFFHSVLITKTFVSCPSSSGSWLLCANQHWSDYLWVTSVLREKNGHKVTPSIKIWTVLGIKFESSFPVIILYWMQPSLHKQQQEICYSSVEKWNAMVVTAIFSTSECFTNINLP